MDKIRNDKKLDRKIAKIEKKLNVSRMKTPLFSIPQATLKKRK